MTAVLTGVGFIAGLLVSTIFVVMGRFTVDVAPRRRPPRFSQTEPRGARVRY